MNPQENSQHTAPEYKKYLSFKGTVKQVEKALINDRLRVLKVSGKLHISTVYNFAVIYP